MEETNLVEISKKIKELPTPDFIVQRIISIASDPQADIVELQEAVLQSPTLTAKILKLANSAYYALPNKVTKLSQAVNLLGFKTVRNLALSIFTVENYFNEKISNFNPYNFWIHLVATGVASELLAKYLNFFDKEEVFMCGILHDLGKIVMAHIMPEIFDMIIKVAEHEKISFCEAENLLSTYSHQQMGKMLFENWNMSDLVIETVTYHDNPLDSKKENFKKHLYIVNAANVTVNMVYYGYSGNYNIPMIQPEVWNFLGLNYNKYLSYFEEFKNNIEKYPEFINMKKVLQDLEV
ncbi:HDOD domain-containing protein [Petrotoga sp. 9PWA.NaAc.5.4]|uniref:HDOD domain-containing protein n=1 Tax=Petrotoga sp. 9PWA.NaAc.5.4 TaxID=1434328 RepID=UPI000CBAE945|nr:HDOD domain-containing protein [Petrotoga sp. 9PWA.NaAc.5.4]PNR97036.1 phosphohydrolase [Petrotoga sp. 9PWA.NaAc.5.4]